MFADGSVGVIPPASSTITVGVFSPTAAEATTIQAISEMIRDNQTLLRGYNFETQHATTNCDSGKAMIELMKLETYHTVANVGDGCDDTTKSLQTVSGSSEHLLVGWGGSTPLLYKTDYFISTADSIRHYFSGIFELCTKSFICSDSARTTTALATSLTIDASTSSAESKPNR